MWMLNKYFRFAGSFWKPEVWKKIYSIPCIFISLNILYYLWSQHNYMKYLPRIQHHSLWCMTDDFHSFTYCAGIPVDFLLNISTWSILFYPVNPRCRITMGEGLKIMNNGSVNRNEGIYISLCFGCKKPPEYSRPLKCR